MSEWKTIDSAPRDGESVLGHSARWESPLPVYWCDMQEEFVFDDSNIGGRGKKYGLIISSEVGQPTHWDYCPLPPPSTT